jgi:hypothetical protein
MGAAGGLAASGGGRLVAISQGGAAAAMVVLLVALVFRFQSAAPWGVGILAGTYLAGRTGHATVDGRAAIVGVLLLLSVELASWSVDVDARIKAERALIVRRTATLLGLCLVALVANFMLLATSAVSASSGAALATVGTAAAVAAVAIVVRLSFRGPPT